MKQVYAPANGPEAHMLAHLLGQSGIQAHIHGEALQGAAGELPVGNVLQLLVADEDYERARHLLLEWERVSVVSDADSSSPRRFRLTGAVLVLGLGLVGGWALKSVFDMSRVSIAESTTEIDRNGDGRTDSTWFYRLGARHAYKGEFDHNHDGRIDTRTFYDDIGTPTEQDEDEDFNGSFETKDFFDNGVITRSEIDSNGNGVADVTRYYANGTLVRDEMTDEHLGTIVRVDTYAGLLLRSADLDLDRDGFLETRRTFDDFGEIVRTETLRRQ
jgi:hypothetical protein